MKSLLIQTYEVFGSDGRRSKILSIFIACHNLTLEEFDAALVEAATNSLGPDAIHLVGYSEDISKLRGWLQLPEVVALDRLRDLVGSIEENLRLIQFDAERGIHTVTSFYGNEVVAPDLLPIEQEQTLIAAFRRGGGEEKAPFGTHFSKTSHSHADRFLRVSNVLEDGAIVRLVAYWLLPHLWKMEIRSVVVDTSGIYSVASIAIQEAASRGGLVGHPMLWSHRSHDGVDEIQKHDASTGLFLISASTSGGLCQRLIAKGAFSDRVITLFYLSENRVIGGKILCDLQGMDKKGLNPIKNLDSKACWMCNRNFHLIRIQGDQFSISPPNVEQITVKATDLDVESKINLSGIVGLRSFFAYRRRGNDRICSLGIDVEPILNAVCTKKNQAFLEGKRRLWDAIVRRSSIVSLRNVVATSYPKSESVAGEIATNVRSALSGKGDCPQVIGSNLLRTQSPEPKTSRIVVSACIDEGNELQAVSRTLRDIQPDGSISYLSIACLMEDTAEMQRLTSNLTRGQHGAGTHSFHTLINLQLQCYEEKPSWTEEAEQLRRVIDWADANDKNIEQAIEIRIRRLQDAPANGLIDDLFWPAPDGSLLGLRSDFTFIPDALQPPSATQADLFAVISLILSRLRFAKLDRRLSHNAYERAVLAPANFDRFNDGVLQACFLRAARPNELAYGACDESVSEEMLGILRYTIQRDGVPEKAEALMEFLIALLTRRMTLHQEHLRSFCDEIIATTGHVNNSGRLLAEYMIWRESDSGQERRMEGAN